MNEFDLSKISSRFLFFSNRISQHRYNLLDGRITLEQTYSFILNIWIASTHSIVGPCEFWLEVYTFYRHVFLTIILFITNYSIKEYALPRIAMTRIMKYGKWLGKFVYLLGLYTSHMTRESAGQDRRFNVTWKTSKLTHYWYFIDQYWYR